MENIFRYPDKNITYTLAKVFSSLILDIPKNVFFLVKKLCYKCRLQLYIPNSDAIQDKH